MNVIFEAVRSDGTHKLISPSVIRGYCRDARLYPANRRKRVIAKMLSALMASGGYIHLEEIKYDGDGNQSRAVVIYKYETP